MFESPLDFTEPLTNLDRTAVHRLDALTDLAGLLLHDDSSLTIEPIVRERDDRSFTLGDHNVFCCCHAARFAFFLVSFWPRSCATVRPVARLRFAAVIASLRIARLSRSTTV